MVNVTDDRGVRVQLASPPKRIVSLVPSTTETLFALGLGDRVVGITRFCVHPKAELVGVAKVGGTKDAELERVLTLEPDLVVGNCEENTREIFDALQPHVPVYAAFPRTVDHALADLRRLGRLLGVEARAEDRAAWVEEARAELGQAVARHGGLGFYAYLIWRDPWMGVSDDTFIAAMLAEAGGQNVLAEETERFPTVSPSLLGALAPERILLSSEPFPFRERHREELAEATGLGRERFRFVDGELCSWHGVRMEAGFRYLAAVLAGRA